MFVCVREVNCRFISDSSVYFTFYSFSLSSDVKTILHYFPYSLHTFSSHTQRLFSSRVCMLLGLKILKPSPAVLIIIEGICGWKWTSLMSLCP